MRTRVSITKLTVEKDKQMPRVDEYQNGTPSWVDLAAADLTGSKEFYSGLFGWDFVDEQMEEMGIGTYSMAMVDGAPASA